MAGIDEQGAVLQVLHPLSEPPDLGEEEYVKPPFRHLVD